MGSYRLSETFLRNGGRRFSCLPLAPLTPRRESRPLGLEAVCGTGSPDNPNVVSSSLPQDVSVAPMHATWLQARNSCYRLQVFQYVVNPAHFGRQKKLGVCPVKDGVLLRETTQNCMYMPQPHAAVPILTELARFDLTLHHHPDKSGHVMSSQCGTSLDHPKAQSSLMYSKTTPTHHPLASPRQGDEDLPSPAQLSFILLKLREEVSESYCNNCFHPVIIFLIVQLPSFFSGHHSYGMYSLDMIFTNNLLPFTWTLYSRWGYHFFLAASRILLRMAYSNLNLDLLRITKDVDSGKIEARWGLRGRPRLRFQERCVKWNLQ